MKYTGNYNLKKPEGSDIVNIEDFNDNADIIDQALKAHDDALATKETPQGAQAKADAALNSAKQYTDQEVGEVAQALTTHLADNVKHITSAERTTWNSKADANIREDINKTLKVEVVSSSVSETPDAGRIIFDTSQGKFFGGNGTEWV